MDKVIHRVCYEIDRGNTPGYTAKKLSLSEQDVLEILKDIDRPYIPPRRTHAAHRNVNGEMKTATAEEINRLFATWRPANVAN